VPNFDFGSIKFNFDFKEKAEEPAEFQNRYLYPDETPEIDEEFIKYENAEKLAKTVDLAKRLMIIVNGSFIMGDFLESLIVLHNFHIKRMIISTLSMSENNVDSLKNLLEGDYIDKLDLIVSDYFFKTEQDGHGASLIPYLYNELDINDRFQLSVSRSHTKVFMFETHCGKKITMHGSANLRSSANLENLMIENSTDLYDFFEKEIYNPIIEKYWTIDYEREQKKLERIRSKKVALPRRKQHGK